MDRSGELTATGDRREARPPQLHRVLLVDKDPKAPKFLKLNLRAINGAIEVGYESNPTSALRRLAKERLEGEPPPDLIISGFVFGTGRKNGLDFAHDIRERYSDTFVAIVTSQANDIEHSQLEQSGAHTMLLKPLNRVALEDLLRQAENYRNPRT